MSHGLRWSSELDVNKTTARIVDTFKSGGVARGDGGTSTGPHARQVDPVRSPISTSGAAHAGPGGFPSASARPDNPARLPNDGSIPIAAGRYPKVYPLVGLCRAAGLPTPTPEFEWHPTRRYRADYGFPIQKVLIEYDGGLFINGGHSRGAARRHDMEKDRAATLLGFRTLRYEPDDMNQTVADLLQLFA